MSDKHYAVAIITAVPRETEGVMRLYSRWERIDGEDGAQAYYETTFRRSGETFRLVTAQQDEMGMTAAASLSHNLIARFHPQYLIMTGIAAGIGAEQLYGDVIIPNVIWNYAGGRFVRPEEADIHLGNVGFQPRPSSLTLSPDIEALVRRVAADPENQFHIHLGPMACGTAVVANREVVDQQVRSQLPTTAGLDMESYGVFYAARKAWNSKTEPIVIKSICDYADEEKCDLYQKFAAFTSSEFAKLLYERYLPLRRAGA